MFPESWSIIRINDNKYNVSICILDHKVSIARFKKYKLIYLANEYVSYKYYAIKNEIINHLKSK